MHVELACLSTASVLLSSKYFDPYQRANVYDWVGRSRIMNNGNLTCWGFDRITTDPRILGGKPCIRGMALVSVNEQSIRVRKLPVGEAGD